MSTQPETKIVNLCKRRLKAEFPGCRLDKLADRFTRGLPDLQFSAVVDGVFVHVEIECKTPLGRLSKLQSLRRLSLIDFSRRARRGVVSYEVVHDAEDLDRLILGIQASVELQSLKGHG